MDPTDIPPDLFARDPEIHPSAFIAQGVQLMGDVRLAAESSVWYNAVVRGDVNYIEVGPRSNIQDGCILHVTNVDPCIIGADVTAGHNANLHGCTVEDTCLIGIGAIVLSGAQIGRGSIVGAGAVVKEGQVIPPLSLVVGVPGKIVRQLPDSTCDTHRQWAQKYIQLAAAHRTRFSS
ncbi:MAG: gamma carbonic anhydrase family protein [Candidatus Latescibacteria bacterium]|nr:gamma carbonic anhydrase family protein [Candidatus Latescibacterota bacterium]